MWQVYVLKSEVTLRHYVGMTQHVKRRLREHNAGLVRSTKKGRPWRVLYIEEESSRERARVREKYWKSGAGRRRMIKSETVSPVAQR